MTKHKKSKLPRTLRRRSRRLQQRKRTMKRGGMTRTPTTATAATAARRYMVHNVLPLFQEFQYRIGDHPKSDSIVRKGERVFPTIVDIPADDALKASITELTKEWKSTEKNAEKALGLYNKLLQTLKDAEKRQKKETPETPRRAEGTFASSPLYGPLSSITPLSLLRQEPFGTPPFVAKPDLTTPLKPSGIEKVSQSVLLSPSTTLAFAPTLDNESAVKKLFDDDDEDDHDNKKTPLSSPSKMRSPPRLKSKSRHRDRRP